MYDARRICFTLVAKDMEISMKVLITGANGLLGSEAVKYFSAIHEVHALCHRLGNCQEGVSYHYLDFAEDWSISRLPERVDVILHLAQSSKFREFPDQALDVFNVNIASTAKILDYARTAGCQKFIFASSGGIYESGAALIDENSPIVPHGQLGYYLASKLSGELLVRSYAGIMDVSILRLFFMYGRAQRRSMLLPRLVDNVRAGSPIQLQGDEGLVINPVHVSDAVSALECIMQQPGSSTFNIAGSEVVSLRQLALQISAKVGVKPVFDHVPGAHTRLVADISALRALGWIPKVGLPDGLEELV